MPWTSASGSQHGSPQAMVEEVEVEAGESFSLGHQDRVLSCKPLSGGSYLLAILRREH